MNKHTVAFIDSVMQHSSKISDRTHSEFADTVNVLADKFKLKYISHGSSRIVYEVTPTTVIKVAMNLAGIAQNQAEISLSRHKHAALNSVVDYSEMEVCSIHKKAAKLPDYFHEFGLNRKQLSECIHYCAMSYNPDDIQTQKIIHHSDSINIDIYEQFLDTQFGDDLFKLSISRKLSPGDIITLSDKQYGLVNNKLKLIDYGLNADVYSQYYS